MQKIYFITNRNPNKKGKPTNFGRHFNPDGLACLRFGSAQKKAAKIIISTAAEKLQVNAAGTAEDPDNCSYGSEQVFAELQKNMREQQRDTLIFVHGYNNSFRDGLRNGFVLAKQFPETNIVVFSWPSDGSMLPWLAYSNDRHDAAASGPALARGLLKLTDYLCDISKDTDCGQRVHLLAHSMGAYVLRHSLQYYRSQTARLSRVLDQIILVAADEDSDAFEFDYKLKALPQLGEKVSVYYNRQDRVMALSDLSKGNPERLGQAGLQLPFNVPAKVCQINCSRVVGGIAEHNYYRQNPWVIADLQAVLAGEDAAEINNRYFQQDLHSFVLKKSKNP
ncbi:MAG: alpha/beta fold hydrolase [Xanthomonadales bacterium]|nr:alpha/beta fold hydrolase [Xanthomonadales bacterium]